IASGVDHIEEVQNPEYVVVPGFGVRWNGETSEIMDRRMELKLKTKNYEEDFTFIDRVADGVVVGLRHRK
ncbi:MAG: hypothetical protein II786_02515, partial [Muribaculaceae bacterium]|nr:hypothetical protein [Muribaculaceae bacterium]